MQPNEEAESCARDLNDLMVTKVAEDGFPLGEFYFTMEGLSNFRSIVADLSITKYDCKVPIPKAVANNPMEEDIEVVGESVQEEVENWEEAEAIIENAKGEFEPKQEEVHTFQVKIFSCFKGFFPGL